MLDNEGWNVRDNIATTTSMKDKLLNPGESEIVEITFEWNLADGAIGERFNEAEITAYANKYDAIDITEDNKDKEGLLVTLKTGSNSIAIVTVVTFAIGVVALGVVGIKSKLR